LISRPRELLEICVPAIVGKHLPIDIHVEAGDGIGRMWPECILKLDLSGPTWEKSTLNAYSPLNETPESWPLGLAALRYVLVKLAEQAAGWIKDGCEFV
jgi:hypothetical protein